MDYRVLCVYNLARGVSLSSKVTVADGANQPLTILKVLVGGLAMDSKSGLWISPVHDMPSVPRLFPFDLLYLGDGLEVLDVAEYAPGMEFPHYHREVASALVLPSGSLQSSRTEQGDCLLICPAEEMDRRIAAFGTGASIPARMAEELPTHFAPPRGDHSPTNGFGFRIAAPAGSAAAVAEEVMVSVSGAALHESRDASLEITPTLTSVVEAAASNQAVSLIQTEEVKELESAPATTKIEPIVGAASEEAATEPAAASDAESATSASPAPLLSITEVVLERPRPVDSPVVGLREEVEDLFANWMEAPTLASTWKTGLAEPAWQQIKPPVVDSPEAKPITAEVSPSPVIDPAIAVPDVAPVELAFELPKVESEVQLAPPIETAVVAASMNSPESEPASLQKDSPEINAETAPLPAVSKAKPELPKASGQPAANSTASIPVRIALPQPPQATPQPSRATTSTVGQYGLWRASLPTAAIPLAMGREQGKQVIGDAQAAPAPKKAETTTDIKANVKVQKVNPEFVDSKGPEPISASPKTESETLPVKAQPSSEASQAPPAEVKKRSAGKGMEAASPKPIVPENMLGAVERNKSGYKAVVPAASEKKVRDSVKTPPERPLESTSASAVHELPTEAVDSVQRKLGIGLAKTEVPTVATGEEAESSLVENAAPPEAATPEPILAIQPLAVHESPEPSGSSLTFAPPEITAPNGKKTTAHAAETNGKHVGAPKTLAERFKRWLNPVATTNSDRRRAHRRYVPGMVAHYYTGGPPKPHDIADISMTGFYLLTEDRWMPDTMIQMTLQKPCAKGERKQSITVLSRIVRRGSDGVAAQFVMPESLDPRSHDVQPTQTTDRFALARFI